MRWPQMQTLRVNNDNRNRLGVQMLQVEMTILRIGKSPKNTGFFNRYLDKLYRTFLPFSLHSIDGGILLNTSITSSHVIIK